MRPRRGGGGERRRGLEDDAAAPTPTADAVVAEIEAAGGRAVASYDTVATPEGGAAIVDRAVEHFGTVDAVVHNAGVWRNVPFDEMTVDQLEPVLDVHLRGAFFVTRPRGRSCRTRATGASS